jgi:hypothetical protein
MAVGAAQKVTPATTSKVAKHTWVVKLATFNHGPSIKVLIFLSFWKGCQLGQLGPPRQAGHLRCSFQAFQNGSGGRGNTPDSSQRAFAFFLPVLAAPGSHRVCLLSRCIAAVDLPKGVDGRTYRGSISLTTCSPRARRRCIFRRRRHLAACSDNDRISGA